jgi:hypothetical protein
VVAALQHPNAASPLAVECPDWFPPHFPRRPAYAARTRRKGSAMNALNARALDCRSRPAEETVSPVIRKMGECKAEHTHPALDPELHHSYRNISLSKSPVVVHFTRLPHPRRGCRRGGSPRSEPCEPRRIPSEMLPAHTREKVSAPPA